jgi:hypothetical protein
MFLSLFGHVMSAGHIERDFCGAGRALPPMRNAVDPRYFQAQLLSNLNKALVDVSTMDEIGMSIKDVHSQLPSEGFNDAGEISDLSDSDDEVNTVQID